jgi:hypothetical protein
VNHIPEKLAIPKDHFWQYSISIDNTARDLEFVLLILKIDAALDSVSSIWSKIWGLNCFRMKIYRKSIDSYLMDSKICFDISGSSDSGTDRPARTLAPPPFPGHKTANPNTRRVLRDELGTLRRK